MSHEEWIEVVVQKAIDNVVAGGGPFAALVVRRGTVIGAGVNLVEKTHDPTAHAELLAIQEACTSLQSSDLSDCVLYASGEPCPMCLGAAYWANVQAIYYGCSKSDAFIQTNFGNPLEHFFTDQTLEMNKRSVPIHHIKTDTVIQPFIHWSTRGK